MLPRECAAGRSPSVCRAHGRELPQAGPSPLYAFGAVRVADAHSDPTGSGKRCHNQSEMRIIDARFIVRDADGQALACVYFEEGWGRRSAAHLLTRDEARRIAGQHCQALDAASTQHRLSLRRSLRMRSSKDSVSIPLYRLLPLSDIRHLPTYSGATGPRRPSVKSRLEISHEERSIH